MVQSGERYGYANHLWTERIAPYYKPTVLFQDVNCKFEGWNKRVLEAFQKTEVMIPDISTTATTGAAVIRPLPLAVSLFYQLADPPHELSGLLLFWLASPS